MTTQKATLRLLCKSIITRLENQKAITFPPRLRQIVQDEVTHLIGPLVLTDEDIRERAFAKMGARAESLQESLAANATESEQFHAAQAVVKNQVGQDALNGFYFQKAPKEVAEIIVQYLMRSSHIDDVYETDEDLIHKILEIVRKFKASDAH